MHALRHLAVVKAQQREFVVAMDVRDAADRLCKDQRLRAERAVLDDPRSICDIATLLAKQGRELRELRARHRATRARLDREMQSWEDRSVFFPGPENVDKTETEPAALSPAPRALVAPALAVTPSWGAFRTPAGETWRHAGTATKAFLEAGGDRYFSDFGARGCSSAVPEAKILSPAIRALDFDGSEAGQEDKTPHRGISPLTTQQETSRTIDGRSKSRDPRPRPASAWSRFGRRGTWLRRPSANDAAVTAAGVRSSSGGSVSLSSPRLALPRPGEARAAECEDWRAVSLGAPADVAPQTAANDWRSLAMTRARDPGTRAAAARAYGEYRDALDVVSADADDPKRTTIRGFANARAAAETRRAPFLGRRDRSSSSDRVGLDDGAIARDEAWTRRGQTGPTGRRAPACVEDAWTTAAENDDDARVWSPRGASLRRAVGVGESRRRGATSPVAVDASASFAHEALRPLDAERVRREDARLRAGGGAKGRLPTGAFFEARRGEPAGTRRGGAWTLSKTPNSARP